MQFKIHSSQFIIKKIKKVGESFAHPNRRDRQLFLSGTLITQLMKDNCVLLHLLKKSHIIGEIIFFEMRLNYEFY